MPSTNLFIQLSHYFLIKTRKLWLRFFSLYSMIQFKDPLFCCKNALLLNSGRKCPFTF